MREKKSRWGIEGLAMMMFWHGDDLFWPNQSYQDPDLVKQPKCRQLRQLHDFRIIGKYILGYTYKLKNVDSTLRAIVDRSPLHDFVIYTIFESMRKCIENLNWPIVIYTEETWSMMRMPNFTEVKVASQRGEVTFVESLYFAHFRPHISVAWFPGWFLTTLQREWNL